MNERLRRSLQPGDIGNKHPPEVANGPSTVAHRVPLVVRFQADFGRLETLSGATPSA